MAHKRDEIRKIIVDALKNKTLAGENVFNWKLRPIEIEHLPCISVIIPEETATEISGGGDLIHRRAEVYVIIYNAALNNNDNMSDEISRQVEFIMNNLNQKDFSFKYQKMEINQDKISMKSLISCALQYQCNYFTEEKEPIETNDLEELSIEVCQHG